MITKSQFFKSFTNNLPGASTKALGGIYFEHLSMDGLSEMNAYSMDERLYEFFEFDPFKNISETEDYLNKLLRRMSGDATNRTSSYWFVRRYSDGALIGTAGLTNLDYARKSVEWGYGINPDLWGLGYILHIQEALKNFVFEKLELNRLHGITMVQNHRTIESVAASGFLHEGIARSFYNRHGEYIDGWRYAMTQADYKSQSTLDKPQKTVISLNDIIQTVASVLDSEIITKESSMENTVSWDSLTHMQVILALKSELLVVLSPSEIANSVSVRGIFASIQAQAGIPNE